MRLFPATVEGEVDALACRTKEQNLLGNAERLEMICRQRLGSLAWLMRSLYEPIGECGIQDTRKFGEISLGCHIPPRCLARRADA